MSYKSKVQALLANADIATDGKRPVDLHVHDERFYRRVFLGGSLAIGESYMDGWWDCEDLVECTNKLFRAKILDSTFDPYVLWLFIKARLTNLQSKRRAFVVGEQHYDLGNDLYEATLGPYLQYTCNLWEEGVTTQREAEERKLQVICESLGLKRGDRILDIGCGWGGLAKYAIEHYGVSVVGLSVSSEQKKYAESVCKGLPFSYVVSDWREYDDAEGFDHVTSIEMIEHVGPKNYDEFFERIAGWLKPEGRLFLQAISFFRDEPRIDPWLEKYIFPNAMLPSLSQVEKTARPYLLLESVRNIGPHYEPTLLHWWESFDAAYGQLSQHNPKYDERFYRMWRYYLLTCAGMFRARFTQDLQYVFTKTSIPRF